MSKTVGMVKWFNNAKGYGFIEQPGEQDIFVHYSAISGDGYKTLIQGQEVEFEVTNGPKGAIGYCLGGRYALQAAAMYADDFRAAASIHGTRLATDSALSPHKLAARCRGEIYCAFAEHDDFGAPPVRQALLDAYSACPNVKYRPALHQNSIHGYALPNRDIYEKRAANRDWEMIFAMFSRNLDASRRSHASA